MLISEPFLWATGANPAETFWETVQSILCNRSPKVTEAGVFIQLLSFLIN